MSWPLHSVVGDCCFLVVTIVGFVLNARDWFALRHWFNAATALVLLPCIAYWSYNLALDAAPDPPTIPCVEGMTLLPHQACTLRIEIVIPRNHDDRSL